MVENNMQGNAKHDVAADDVVLRVEHVAKMFRLPTEQASGLKQALINWTRGIKGYREQQVLRDITFDVHRGDFFGIVGRNGSGKSTLLKLISGIYVPEKGVIDVEGKLVPFIELGVGFNPELTGRENVFLNGALLGFTHEEIEDMYDDIVEFAELEDFMDQKLKNYSSGMQVRLAFSVAIKAQGDILVLDEVLAVGDEAFQRKCDNFFTQIKKDPSKTVILVTHSMDSVKKYCNKAILIKDGEIVINGDKDEVANRYTLENFKSESSKKDKKDDKKKSEYPTGLSEHIPFLKVKPSVPLVEDISKPFRFDVEYEITDTDLDECYMAMSLLDLKRGGITYDPGAKAFTVPVGKGRKVAHFEMPVSIFNDGDFRIFVALRKQDPDNPDETTMIGFTNDENAGLFSIRVDHEHGYALLNDSVMHITQITE
ncbi:ABC transporter ATP-binding protein [Bifidobacterium sp. 82T24]|uniref:ABC transporter ATP-binding protein n=1 Tax=Bifidobacterium pluvialisilvae TaxID=2834436 RepID=UPI001C59825C|nr:ABC transporter ATP-binding protein [Bifidobacterium pluvialisilvae]MBW3087462.1 ABC transporter ATP-binding protein [Bifidobacterium pluvialisilvae]